MLAMASAEGKDEAAAPTKFYPPIQAFDEGMLKVSDIYTVYYAQYGNPEGKPVLFVHGGPGNAHTSSNDT